MRPEEAARLRELAEKLLGLTKGQGDALQFTERESHERSHRELKSHEAVYTEEQLLKAARAEIERHKLRRTILPSLLSSGGSWNILLDLFEGEQIDRDSSITSTCIAADVPTTTGLRYIGQLLDAGLVQKIPDPNDNRRTFLRFSRKGSLAMRELLSAMIDVELAISKRQRLSGRTVS